MTARSIQHGAIHLVPRYKASRSSLRRLDDLLDAKISTVASDAETGSVRLVNE